MKIVSAVTKVTVIVPAGHTGWGEMLNDIYERGVEKVGLICVDGLKGLEDVICEVFPGISSRDAPRTSNAT